MGTYDYPRYAARPLAELKARSTSTADVAIVGGGMVGLTMALELARRGVGTVVLDEDDTVSHGSRAICQAQRTLEVWDRLGLAEPMMARGVTWNEGRVYHRDRELYSFNLRKDSRARFPAFINLQQYHVEATLAEAAHREPLIDLRWRNRVTAIDVAGEPLRLGVETPEGGYEMPARYVIAADGARSTIRRQLGLQFRGKVFEDHFLIADIVMDAPFPAERRFWFDPPFAPGQSALLHMQPDRVWRLDFQLGWNIDRDRELEPEAVRSRVRRMLGEDIAFELEWVSIYTFQCRRLDRFRHGRVLFVGDAAHQVSPFGARGGNSGVQDVDNLGWKLALVLDGRAPESLLDSYDAERVHAADENIGHSTRATEFITPKTDVSRIFRDATLELAGRLPFARAFVNSGRLSTATVLPADGPGNVGGSTVRSGVPVGAPCPNLPAISCDGAPGHLLGRLDGAGFVCLLFVNGRTTLSADDRRAFAALAGADIPVRTLIVDRAGGTADADHLPDPGGLLADAFGAEDGACWLVRPDQHVAARWPAFDPARVASALDRICGRSGAVNPRGA
ncbi:FAD-dependent oxidoreductase [Oceanibacterium hippocampi]|uniref:3-(3-hydroxy-phenyl)propionate/3-hydroxycinnamic acid hydroxylase n=1 Tax=Oceanibacterium hippocampi TaxID=745714 RepID=A0A1Y5TZA4_9PROT|nr:FAD-dependent oxidoreductase [Oceanibacterium hippocampi]SLN77416.1 3-(3-hydroxy-phenyl)propionate/3-hydroxycinnamic acid hydroxylase [Oceanibacterium hippocampi]